MERLKNIDNLNPKNSNFTGKRTDNIIKNKLNFQQNISSMSNPNHLKQNKFQYNLKNDQTYGDKKIKISGKLTDRDVLTKDLKLLSNFIRRQATQEFIPKSNKYYSNPINSSRNDNVIEFTALDLSAERESGLNMPIIFLPMEIFKLTHLERLHLDCNLISEIPKLLGQNLINLKVLTLSNNRLKSLPTTMSNLKRLESLHLANNRFEQFPIVICEIKSLKFLDLSSNRLINIPENIDNLFQLESLLLFQNNLKTLPNKIGKLLNLKSLWIGNNRITNLPREIVNLRNLEWDFKTNFNYSTNLSGNPLIEPPYEICEQGLDSILNYFESKKTGNLQFTSRENTQLVNSIDT